MAKRIQPGDVFEVNLPNGKGYVLYVSKHPEYGHAISVCPRVFSEQPPLIDALFQDSYITFYPLPIGMKDGIVTVVARLAVPPMPTTFRRHGAMTGSHIDTWLIDYPDGRTTMTRSLREDQRKLPIASIWSHVALVQRIQEGWRPEMVY